MNRRSFLASATGAAGLLGATGWPTGIRRALSSPTLDAHAHVNSAAVTGWVNGLVGEGTLDPLDGDGVLAALDRDGIERAFVLSTAYMMAMDALPGTLTPDEERAGVERENDYAAAECAKHQGRLIPFLSVNPKRPWAEEEVDRCVDELGMRGLKLHFWNSVVDLREAESLARLGDFFAHVAGRGLPVVVHVFNGEMTAFGPDDVERFLREIVEPQPDLRVSFAHAGGAGGASPWVLQIFQRLTEVAPPGSSLGERLWIDISAVMFTEPYKTIRPTPEAARARMGELMRAWGAERVFWGSDSLPDYLRQTDGAWPLDEGDWSIVAGQDGRRFLGP